MTMAPTTHNSCLFKGENFVSEAATFPYLQTAGNGRLSGGVKRGTAKVSATRGGF